MDNQAEHLQQETEWYPIIPSEEIPEGVDTWIVEIPGVGKLFVTMENKAGSTGYPDDDDEAYVLSSGSSELKANGEALLKQGFRTLRVALTPNDDRTTILAQLGLKGRSAKYEAFLQRDEIKRPLTPMGYWARATATPSEYNVPRDVMVDPSRKQLEQVQISFPEGGDN